jgi:hypothetical protein
VSTKKEGIPFSKMIPSGGEGGIGFIPDLLCNFCVSNLLSFNCRFEFFKINNKNTEYKSPLPFSGLDQVLVGSIQLPQDSLNS